MDDSPTILRRFPVSVRELLVWAYVIGLSVLAGVGWLLFTHGIDAHAEPRLAWWAVALGFAVGELCVVHVRFRRSAHSFSLADAPFVFGLVFATGDDFVLGAVIGTALVCGLVRRLELVKVFFNAAQLALAATLASGLLHLISGSADAMEPATWVGLYAATLAAGALTIALLGCGIAIAEGKPGMPMLVQMFATD